jgi:hypothetical protein
MRLRDGVVTTYSSKSADAGLFWFHKKMFSDFSLRLECNVDTTSSNSGILVRFPNAENHDEVAAPTGYEVDIFGAKSGTIVALPDRHRPIRGVSLKPGDWNQCGIHVVGQKYEVRINGESVTCSPEIVRRPAISVSKIGTATAKCIFAMFGLRSFRHLATRQQSRPKLRQGA